MITEEMIADFKSRNWSMWDFCMKHDCGAEVYQELSQRYGIDIGRRDLTNIVDADAFVAGFVHDELGGDLAKLGRCSLLPGDCKTPFYKIGTSSGGFLNDIIIKRIVQLVWPEDFIFPLDRLVYANIFTVQNLFGKAMAQGFATLRRAGADDALIEKGKELAGLRYTIGNIIALPQKICKSWWDNYPRFDLFFDQLLKGLDEVENAPLRQLIQENQDFFVNGRSAFLSRHFLQDFSSNMGEAYAMPPFSKEDANGNAEAYLRSAELFIDAAIKVITSRAERIVDRLESALEGLAPSFGLTV